MIRFRDFEKRYNQRLIVAAPHLELAHTLYWLRGGNGSGKTTLLNAMAGLIPFKGRIEVNGRDTHRHRAAYRLAVNHAAAEPVYPDFLTGIDLVSFYRHTKGGTAVQAARLTELLGIREYMPDKTGTYSSGMMKKLSLVLAFIGNPELILLDEPLITLDAPSVEALMALIAGSCKDGITLLVTSHQQLPLLPALSAHSLSFRDKILSADL